MGYWLDTVSPSHNRTPAVTSVPRKRVARRSRVKVLGHSTENIGTNPALGQLCVSNVVVRTPSVSVTNFTATAFPLAAGSNVILAAIGDAAGNVGYAAVTVRVDMVTGAAYAYSAAGCVTNIAYAGSGFSSTLALTWNGRYELAGVRTNGALSETYGYDALGRRVTISSGGTTNWLVYDGMHMVAEGGTSGSLVRSYTWGPGIDNLLAFTDYTGGETNTCYALTDHLGAVHALADEAGAIVESYRYDAWGKVLGVYDPAGAPLANHQSAIGNSILWQGREYSWNTGLYYFRARWYDPVTGRWLSNDPIGISGGLNQYVAFDNNPIVFRDPDGLATVGGEGVGPANNK